MKVALLAATVLATLAFVPPALAAKLPPGENGVVAHKARKIVLIFVADGLRYDSVTPQSAPTMWKLKHEGVDLANSHSIYPTITTVNASAIATGHYPGDTGNFGNAIYSGYPSAITGNAPIAVMENDASFAELNDHFGGNYLNEESLLAAVRKAGLATAAIGKVGAVPIQDVTQRDGKGTIVIDDTLGLPGGIPLSPEIAEAIKAAGLAATAPKTSVPNVDQEKYLAQIATKVVLPKLLNGGRDIVMVFWSRDPDATQHSQKDSLGKLSPGINGPTSLAGIKDADDTLAALIAGLKDNGVEKATDIFVTADHGFSTIAKHSKTSASARYDVGNAPNAAGAQNAMPPPDQRDLRPGFLAIDLADALKLPLFDPHTHKQVAFANGEKPSYGDGFIGTDETRPDVMVVTNGGSDHIYIPGANAAALARQIVGILANEDYVSGIFVNDALGDIPETLPMSAINLRGTALTPQPSMLVNFRSFVAPGCKPVLLCAAEVADTSLATGQGMHGTFSRADTKNFMAAGGPDFKRRFVDSAPTGNADIAPTLARILGLAIVAKGGLTGRVIGEALPGGKRATVSRGWQASQPGPDGLKTVLKYQQVGSTRYFDAAGFPGRTVGLTIH
jgi:type I phosphodiesterase/nucleotide pyrophosphatase